MFFVGLRESYYFTHEFFVRIKEVQKTQTQFIRQCRLVKLRNTSADTRYLVLPGEAELYTSRYPVSSVPSLI